ncbi:MAG TPA: HAD family hydrolase, partial [Acidimicrobiales bacterium]|nr:HAD family hydrolase [Acidimicrobiales bacterium]
TVLFDRDGTLVVDVPYNGDTERVRLQPGAREAVARLRRAGFALGVVTNQSGIARGYVSREEVDAVNAHIDQLLGGLDVWKVCPHQPDSGCACRKPAPGLLLQAAAALAVSPSACAVIGDIGTDVAAGLAAGASPILVPTEVTRPEEIGKAPVVATDLLAASAIVLAETR